MRVTPEPITELQPNEVFVFGSNEAGMHGKGAAKMAMKWGAVYGKPFGQFGRTFAIPTKNYKLKTLSVAKIGTYVEKFIEWVIHNKDKKFLVTKIGCGLAGYKPKDIAPLFWGCKDIENLYLPKEFLEII